MYEYENNQIEINRHKYCFDYNIGTVIYYQKKYIVMLTIPDEAADINNIFCLDEQANLLWQSEDLNLLYPGYKNEPYANVGIKDGYIYASDFVGCNYKISLETGKIVGCQVNK